MPKWLSRTEMLFGEEAAEKLASCRVAVFGVGGVGGFAVEALARSGVGALDLIDNDTVAPSNINRQCPATAATIGRPKVEAMTERLKAISPECEVEERFERFERFEGLEGFDAIVDAIDSVACKAELILGATAAGVPLVSSMGAALRANPTKVCVTSFEKVVGDGLARALRHRFKSINRLPASRFPCVWSTEPAISTLHPPSPIHHPSPLPKGSLMQVTATFGMCLAGETIKAIITKGGKK